MPQRPDASEAVGAADPGGAAEAIDRYLAHLQSQRRLSPHTVDGYARDLAQLVALMRDDGLASPAALHHFQIRHFAARLHGRDLHPRSIARTLSAWRGLFRWLAERGEVTSNPVDGVKPPKRGKPLPKALSPDDAVRLVAAPRPGRDAGAAMQRCDRAMFELLYSSGLRVSELTGLDARYVKDGGYASAGWLDADAAEVLVTGKGGKQRSVPVGAPAMQALADWLAVREPIARSAPGDGRHALFLTAHGSRMSPRAVQRRIKAHAQALGIPADVHPHMLRHSFASHVLQSSGDLRAVQEMLGHASIAATQVYTSLDFQRLAQVYDAAHPRAKKRPD